MTTLEQHLLDTIQDAFPLEERPYQVLADMFNAQGSAGEPSRESFTEQQVFDAVENLRNSGAIRRLGGVYDSHRLGFISRLCAGKVADIDKFAAAVNEIPAITHNYVRTHEYNVWFTVIAQFEEEIRAVVDALCSATDLHDVHVLSVTKKFKINTVMRGSGAPVTPKSSLNAIAGNTKTPLSLSGKARIRIACGDLPHTLMPFADWGVPVAELREDLAQKRMRRFGAILRHQQAGFAHNAMVCFDAPTTAGDTLAQNPHISHCYERPAFECFPYTLYAMMHAGSAEELDRYIKDAAASIGNPDYAVLHSVCELKKTSFSFFA